MKKFDSDYDDSLMCVISEQLQHGNIEPEEMARTFNCGVGMVLAVSPDQVAATTSDLEKAGETVYQIGEIREGLKGCTVSGGSDTWSAMSDWTATHNG